MTVKLGLALAGLLAAGSVFAQDNSPQQQQQPQANAPQGTVFVPAGPIPTQGPVQYGAPRAHYAPPPVQYGPPPVYYAPPPPPVYYGNPNYGYYDDGGYGYGRGHARGHGRGGFNFGMNADADFDGYGDGFNSGDFFGGDFFD